VNIVFICRTYFPEIGGAASCVEDIAQAASQAGHRLTVVAGLPSGSAARREELRGVQVIRLEYPPQDLGSLHHTLSGVTRSFRFLLALGAIIRQQHADVVCLGLAGVDSFFVALLTYVWKVRLIVHLHGSEIRAYVKVSPLVRWGLRRCLRQSYVSVAVSEDLKREAIDFCPAACGKIRVIPNGVDGEGIRREEPYRRPRNYILYIGRLHPVKGVEILIRAFSDAAEQLQEIDLLIAGDGPEQAHLQEFVSQSGMNQRIEFIGRCSRAQAFSLLNGCEYVVAPSLSEGCPLVVLEAQAAGKVVIGSRTAGIRDLVEDSGTGFLFEPGDVPALSLLMVRCHEDRALRERVEENLRDRSTMIRQRFQSFLDQHVSLLVADGTAGR
jgi:glycosyltransferase involved in cell wall biosynthesis